MNLTTEVCMGELIELASLPECWISVAEERKWEEFWALQESVVGESVYPSSTGRCEYKTIHICP